MGGKSYIAPKSDWTNGVIEPVVIETVVIVNHQQRYKHWFAVTKQPASSAGCILL